MIDQDFPITLRTAPLALARLWQDEHGVVWLQAKDASLLCVPVEFLSRVRELFVRAEKRKPC